MNIPWLALILAWSLQPILFYLLLGTKWVNRMNNSLYTKLMDTAEPSRVGWALGHASERGNGVKSLSHSLVHCLSWPNFPARSQDSLWLKEQRLKLLLTMIKSRPQVLPIPYYKKTFSKHTTYCLNCFKCLFTGRHFSSPLNEISFLAQLAEEPTQCI